VRLYYCKQNVIKASKIVLMILALFTGSINQASAADGKALFSAQCASCHHPVKKLTGPALQGVSARVPGKDWLYKWIHNPAATAASGDKYAQNLMKEYAPTVMTAFPNLTTEEIDAIISYVEGYKAPVVSGGDGGGDTAMGGSKGSNSSDTFLYFIITALLGIVAFVMMRVNKKLHQAAADKVGYEIKRDVPWYKHKLYLAILGVLAFVGFGAWLAPQGIKLGRSKNYMPDQPIFYSHKVHAGINQINCQYCHSAAEKGKHAMIPSVNVCMNCHKAINEYTGAEEHPLISLEGKKKDGTAEIGKLYKAAGWDPIARKFTAPPKPIEWVKIHNLPDHVNFSHQTHVKNGKVACQRCHGPIQEMDEVYQFSDLSMGFCINCHREQKVQFEENKYYTVFEDYWKEKHAGLRDSVTVADVGGLECAKCHY
jgi:mono/diheme cytochrome c family protein